MPYTNEYGSQSSWSSMLDGFVQLVQIATAAASAKLLQDPEARAVLQRGYVVAYASDQELRQRSFERFSQRIELISVEYRELYASFESLHSELRYTESEAHSLAWDEAQRRGLAHDCVEIDRFRQRIITHLTQCAILHAQAVCSVTEYLENIHKAYICPPGFGPIAATLQTPAYPGGPAAEPERNAPDESGDEDGVRRRPSRRTD